MAERRGMSVLAIDWNAAVSPTLESQQVQIVVPDVDLYAGWLCTLFVWYVRVIKRLLETVRLFYGYWSIQQPPNKESLLTYGAAP
jgi:hypothetical protein